MVNVWRGNILTGSRLLLRETWQWFLCRGSSKGPEYSINQRVWDSGSVGAVLERSSIYLRAGLAHVRVIVVSVGSVRGLLGAVGGLVGSVGLCWYGRRYI